MTGAVWEAVGGLLGSLKQEISAQGWDEELGRQTMRALADAGWLGVGLQEGLGGEGGDLADVLEVVDAIGGTGWPSPVPDLLLVGNGLFAHAGVARPSTSVVVVPALGDASAGGVTVAADGVPWAPWATHFAVVSPAGDGAACLSIVESGHARLRTARNLAGAPLADVRLDRAPAHSTTVAATPADGLVGFVRDLGALSRAVLSRSALRRVQQLTVEHVRAREQFGRPLSAFQAVQQHLAALACEVAAAEAAVDAAVRGVATVAEFAGGPRLATARVRVASAASEVVRLAHQLHGAIGVTREYELHRHTLSLLAWRDEFGTQREWAAYLAEAAAASPDLWSWLLDEV
ncbi:acyl-CoA dehydrogenase family protein [Dactylosporangium sp. NPDC048998]|uniref:acyl-CoA dehydrogenase family protein n=1 Tax=Dactylosporangium sp. NPDC048998 TaxID=3363976 RepID=UPI00371AF607